MPDTSFDGAFRLQTRVCEDGRSHNLYGGFTQQITPHRVQIVSGTVFLGCAERGWLKLQDTSTILLEEG